MLKFFSLLIFLFTIITITSCSPEDSSEQIMPSKEETNLISCGGDFNSFIEKLKERSYQMGYEPFIVKRFFKNVKQNPAVIQRDRFQGFFKKNIYGIFKTGHD